MADLTEFNTEVPTELEGIDLFPSRIRSLSKAFKESFELDHSFGTSVDTTEIDCDGYHKQLTMPEFSGFDSETGNPITEPEQVTDGAFFFTKKIDGEIELCCENETGAYQMTDKGYIATDLDEWDSKTSISGVTIKKIIYVESISLYIAVGYNTSNYGVIYTSPDLVTWTLRQSNSHYYFHDVILAGSTLIAVSAYENQDTVYDEDITTGHLYTSTNGTTWTYVSFTTGFFGIAYNNGLYIAICNYKDDLSHYYYLIYSSTNLTDWIERSFNYYWSERHFYGLCYGNGLYIVVGSYIYTSPNGISWTNRFTPSAILNSICYANNLFVAVGNSGYIYTSTDGITWSQRASLGYTLYSITYSSYLGGLFVVVGASGKIYSSPDGISWTERTSGISTSINTITQRDNIKPSGETYKNMFLTAGASGVVKTSEKFIKII